MPEKYLHNEKHVRGDLFFYLYYADVSLMAGFKVIPEPHTAAFLLQTSETIKGNSKCKLTKLSGMCVCYVSQEFHFISFKA